MHMRFTPTEKQKIRHYYKRPAMEVAEDWEINCIQGFDECAQKELGFSEKVHIR